MAQYEHLPIYKKAFEMTLYFENVVRNFSRYNKYTLGADLRVRAREVTGLIVQANNRTDRLQTLLALREALEQLKLTIRICKEVKAFNNFKSFEVAINQVIDISRQNEGWIKSVSRKQTGPA